jgi:hypothetical protein
MHTDYILDFGKHAGQPISEVPSKYLLWMLDNTSHEFRTTALAELSRRGEARLWAATRITALLQTAERLEQYASAFLRETRCLHSSVGEMIDLMQKLLAAPTPAPVPVAAAVPVPAPRPESDERRVELPDDGEEEYPDPDPDDGEEPF